MAKSKEMIEAKQLRRKGESIKKIAHMLHVSVSSVSTWCRDTTLTNEQIARLQKRVTDPYYGNKLIYLEEKRRTFNEMVKTLKEEGIKEVGILSQREIFIAGIALYWGEGFKKDHLVGLATSDPKAAVFFINWLQVCFKIPLQDLIVRVTANISYQNRIKTLHSFWSNELHLSQKQFSKPFFQKTTWKKIYENKNEYHGVIRIKVRRSVNLLRKIYGFIEGLTIVP